MKNVNINEVVANENTAAYISNILKRDVMTRYQFLGRMKSDCDYFINQSRSTKYLWAKNISDQINCMDAIYNSFTNDEKPTWITQDEIDSYGFRMFQAYELEYIAGDIYGLMDSYYSDPLFFFKEYGQFGYSRDMVINRMVNDIRKDPENMIAKLRNMTTGIDHDAPFYRDVMNTIVYIREVMRNA